MARALSLTPLRRVALLVVIGVAIAVAATRGQAPGDEPDPVLTATALLPAGQLTGPHHTVSAAVQTPGPYHVFTITSTFGTFEAEGISQVATRIEEIAAMARLDDVNKAGVFAKAAGRSLVKLGTGVVQAVTKPVATAKGIGSGAKRFGVNLGRRTKRTVQRATSDDARDSDASAAEKAGDVAGSAAKSIFGVNRARREWARRIGADPYTTNPVLKGALEEVATIDAAGGIVTSLVIPIPPVVSMTSDVGDLVWGRDSEELRKLNEDRVRELKTSEDGFKAFFRNFTYTVTMQTRLVAALLAVNVPGAGDYIETAAEAEDEREALYFVESAEMLQRFHGNSPVSSMLPDSRAVVARMPAGQAVALLPFDWLRRSGATTAEFRELGDRARKELGAVTLHVRVSGKVTDAAVRALATVGWQQ